MAQWQQAWLGTVFLLAGTASLAEEAPIQHNVTVSDAVKTKITFDIHAQPIGDALKEFGRQSGLHVVLYSILGKGISSPRLAGTYTADSALSTLLANTGLRYEYLDERTVAVLRATQDGVSGEKISAAKVEEQSSPLVLAQGQTESQAEKTTQSAENKAAPALEEIIVTAEKRAESIQDLPIAISAFSGEMLTDRGIEGLESLQHLSPSLQFGDSRTFGGGHVSIRGVGNEVLGGELGVELNQDGVPYSAATLVNMDFFDTERVEVLRGPQGTISGRNATAGAIHIYSKRPTEEFEGGIKATIGNYDRMALEGYLSGPIIGDRLLGRLSVRSDNADGWVTNTLLRETLGSIDKTQARGSLLARVTDNLEAHLILDVLRNRSTYFRVDGGRVRPDVPSLAERFDVPSFDRERRIVQQDVSAHPTVADQYQATLNLVWDLGPSARLTAITGYVDLDNDTKSDGNDAIGAPVLVVDQQHLKTRQVSQEITLTADLTDRLDMIVGGLYLQHDDDIDFILGIPPLGVPQGAVEAGRRGELTTWAGYTQWRYRLTDDIRLTAGVRYTHDSKDLTNLSFGVPTLSADASWNAWTPRFAVDYRPTDNLTLYANVSRGFKSGGFFGASETYDPEYLWNYEGGVKANWLERRLSAAVTGFYMDYTDLQATLLRFDDNLGQQIVETINAQSATVAGMELELDALVTDRFRITAAATWLDATYDELRSLDSVFPELGVPGPGGLNIRDLSGNRLIRAPKWQFNLSGEYSMPLGMSFRGQDLRGRVRASYAWQDKMFFTFFNHESFSQDSYGVVNMSGSIEAADKRWQLTAYANNLLDEFYWSQMQLVEFLPPPYSIASPGLPRMYGVSLVYRY